MIIPVPGQTQSKDTLNESVPGNVDFGYLKQARFATRAILVHLPVNKARALVMPEPVILKGGREQMPGVVIAFEDDVIGLFATRSFDRRAVSFIGQLSGVEYRFQIRASENGIVAPLEIIR